MCCLRVAQTSEQQGISREQSTDFRKYADSDHQRAHQDRSRLYTRSATAPRKAGYPPETQFQLLIVLSAFVCHLLELSLAIMMDSLSRNCRAHTPTQRPTLDKRYPATVLANWPAFLFLTVDQSHQQLSRPCSTIFDDARRRLQPSIASRHQISLTKTFRFARPPEIRFGRFRYHQQMPRFVAFLTFRHRCVCTIAFPTTVPEQCSNLEWSATSVLASRLCRHTQKQIALN